jgi:TetR/AcrR family transcriptional regulator, transcriptional repressor for nem operon
MLGRQPLRRKRRAPPRPRDLAATRATILGAAFEEMYVHGFQGTSIDKIVARTGLTKGALFHIFPTKADLGYAVVDEVIAEMIRQQWVVPLRDASDPLETISRSFDAGAVELKKMPVHHGCPLNNIAQEMSAQDEGFKVRVERVFAEWIETTAAALERGKKKKIVRKEVASRDAAVLLVTLVEGILSLAKTTQSPEMLRSGSRNIRSMVESFRR